MPREDGYKNLIPINKRTTEEQRKIQQDGGKASGAARRRKRSLKEAADLFLSLPVSNRKVWNQLAKAGLDPEDIDNQMAVVVGLQLAAVGGSAQAAKILIDLIDDNEFGPTDDSKEDDLSRSLRELGKELESDG